MELIEARSPESLASNLEAFDTTILTPPVNPTPLPLPPPPPYPSPSLKPYTLKPSEVLDPKPSPLNPKP